MKEERKTILNCFTKKLTFWYEDEFHEVDLAEGDLHDSWNSIQLEDGTCFDFNFTWDKETEEFMKIMTSNGTEEYDNEPRFSIYELIENEDGTVSTDHNSYDSFGIYKSEFIGTNADYFNKDVIIVEEGIKVEVMKELKM